VAETVPLSIGTSLRYRPETIELEAGRPVLLDFRNSDGIEHDFTLDAGPQNAGVNFVVGPGSSGKFPLLIQTPGRYTFYCSLPGHRAAGMEGTLVVRGE
jgi:nitrite reductase (NO-forming)